MKKPQKNLLLTSRATLPAVTAALAAAGLISSAHAQLQTAGDVYVDIDATALAEGTLSSIPNAGTLGGFFEARGGGATVPVIGTEGGTKGIRFDGGDYMQLVGTLGGAVTPPPAGLVGVDAACSIEVWAYNAAIANEETMVSWGHRGGAPDGSNLSFNYGNDGRWGAVGHWGNPDLGWNNAGGAPEAKHWHHLVYTYDGTTTRVYSDGALANLEVLGAGVLNTHPNTSINLATQLEPDGVTPTGALRGSLTLGRVRIHDGVLTDGQILNNYNLEKASFVDPVPPTPQPLASPPVHRYSFSEASGDATGLAFADSIGTANGQVQGAGAQFSGSRLLLPGGASTSVAYGDLPNGLVSVNSTNNGGSGEVSIEGWAKVTGNRQWSRLFDFGSSDVGGGVGGEVVGPGGGGAGLDYIFYSAQIDVDANSHRLEIRNEDPAGGGVVTSDATTATFNTDFHFVVTWKERSGEVKAYENGVEVTGLTTDDAMSDLHDVNVWLGRSNWSGDQNLQGEFDEFRFYDHALSANEVLGNFQAGPDTINTGEQAVRVTAQPVDTLAYESFPASFTVGVAGSPPLSFRWLRNGTPVSGGTAATYTFNAAAADDGAAYSCVVSNFAGGTPHLVTSSAAHLSVRQQAIAARHRYSFNEDATDIAVHDSIGAADGVLRGGAIFTGDGKMVLNGTDAYADLPNNIVAGVTSITVEAWVQDDGSAGWARIFDFGNSGAGEDFAIGAAGAAGTQYLFLSQPSGLGTLRGAYTITGGGGGEQVVEWPGTQLAVGQRKHVVWVSSAQAHTGRLFVDGVMVGQNTAVSLTPDALGPTSNDWLGRSQFNDPLFKGTFDEFRIWSGAMTIGQVVASFNAGPEAPICGVCLTAIKSSGGKVTISWPSFAADYFLESSATLGPGAVWLGVTEPSLDDGEFIHVTLSVDQASLFFRLSR